MCSVDDSVTALPNEESGERRQWFVLCDMKPVHAKLPAYKLLAMRGIVCFTPMHERVFTQGGKRRRELVPVVQDLLFARSTLSVLTPIIEATPTLRYRFVRNYHNRHMTVPDEEMERFMRAVNTADSLRYYRPDEITPAMLGRTVRIVGGPLDGYEGRLLKLRGTRIRRLLVELPNLLSVGVDVSPEYVEVV